MGKSFLKKKKKLDGRRRDPHLFWAAVTGAK